MSVDVFAVLRSIDRRAFPRGEREWTLLRGWILPECPRVLDVGCGDKGRLLDIAPGVPFSTGVDMELPPDGYVGPRHSEYRRLDIRELAEAFEPGSYDCVVALDVIEHLSRAEGDRLLDAMESIASRRVIVFTPNGFLYQPPAPDNPFQEHLSGWTVDDFQSRGYSVTGVNGWRPLRGSYADIRWRPYRFWWRLSLLSQPLVRAHPERAFQLLCRKDVCKPE